MEDAQAAFAGLLAPSQAADDPSSAAEASTAGASDAERALALAIDAKLPGMSEMSALTFCAQALPGGDWSSTATTAEYLAQKELDGAAREIRLQFTVDLAAETAELERCLVEDELYTGEALIDFLHSLDG